MATARCARDMKWGRRSGTERHFAIEGWSSRYHFGSQGKANRANPRREVGFVIASMVLLRVVARAFIWTAASPNAYVDKDTPSFPTTNREMHVMGLPSLHPSALDRGLECEQYLSNLWSPSYTWSASLLAGPFSSFSRNH